MSQQLIKHGDRLFRLILIILVIVLAGQVTAGQARPEAAAPQPMVIVQSFDVPCTTLDTITSTYARLTDLATFTVQSPNSTLELTYNGRIFVEDLILSNGSLFELRVDDTESTVGRARAHLRAAEEGGGGLRVSFTGFFTGLDAGEHTASMWVRASSDGGSGDDAMVNPGCWSTDVLIVREYTPLGFTYLPSVMTP